MNKSIYPIKSVYHCQIFKTNLNKVLIDFVIYIYSFFLFLISFKNHEGFSLLKFYLLKYSVYINIST